jgi:regulator of protease activity HflC (stomatin/prohibitin superfamily)
MEFIIFLGIIAVFFILSGIKVIDQYERGVVLTLESSAVFANPV